MAGAARPRARLFPRSHLPAVARSATQGDEADDRSVRSIRQDLHPNDAGRIRSRRSDHPARMSDTDDSRPSDDRRRTFVSAQQPRHHHRQHRARTRPRPVPVVRPRGIRAPDDGEGPLSAQTPRRPWPGSGQLVARCRRAKLTAHGNAADTDLASRNSDALAQGRGRPIPQSGRNPIATCAQLPSGDKDALRVKGFHPSFAGPSKCLLRGSLVQQSSERIPQRFITIGFNVASPEHSPPRVGREAV